MKEETFFLPLQISARTVFFYLRYMVRTVIENVLRNMLLISRFMHDINRRRRCHCLPIPPIHVHCCVWDFTPARRRDNR